MEKYQLDKLTIIIPFHLDVKERARNLSYVITYLKNYFKNLKIIIGENDITPKLKNHFGCDYIFLKMSDNVFQKTKLLNKMINLSNTEFICSYDSDIIVDPLDLINSYEKLINYEIDFIFPYNRTIIELNDDYVKEHLISFIKNKKIKYDDIIKNNINVHTHASTGAIFMFNKYSFINCGMENELFEGWGYEDDERYYRLTKLNNVIDVMNNPVFHLSHSKKNSDILLLDNQCEKNRKLFEEHILNKTEYDILSDIEHKVVNKENYFPIIKTSKNQAEIKIAFTSIHFGPKNIVKLVNKYSPENNYKYDNLKIVGDWEDYDFIVTNYDFKDLDSDIYRKKGIVIQSEPSWYREKFFPKRYINPEEGIDCYKLFSIKQHHALDFHWSHINSTYSEIKNRYLSLKNRNYNRLTSVISNKYFEFPDDENIDLSYLKRVEFLNKIDKLKIDKVESIKIYGNIYDQFKNEKTTDILKSLDNYQGSTNNKEEILLNSEYSFDSENCCEENYFTEKAFGGIFCDSLTFYYGCPNIEDFIDPRCYIKLDLDDPERSFRLVEEIIISDKIRKILGIINYNKQILVRKLNPLRILKEVVTDKL